MKRKLTKIFDAALVFLLACLGLSNCDDSRLEYGSPRTEYGSPYATYEVKGTVTNVATSNSIKNIRIVRTRYYSSKNDTIYTDNDGKYYFNFNDSPIIDTVKLQVTDIDGEQNQGEFAEQNVNVVFTQADKVQNGDGRWYEGKYSKTQNIQLKQTDNE